MNAGLQDINAWVMPGFIKLLANANPFCQERMNTVVEKHLIANDWQIHTDYLQKVLIQKINV